MKNINIPSIKYWAHCSKPARTTNDTHFARLMVSSDEKINTSTQRFMYYKLSRYANFHWASVTTGVIDL